MDSDSTQDSMGPIWPHGKDQFDNMNSKIMLGAVISLSFVITVVLILHIYARCVMRRNQARIRQAEAASVHHFPLQGSQQLTDQPLTGLDPRVIASLPLIIVKARDSNHNDQEHEEKMPGFDCAVCLSDLEEGEMARLLPNCKHRFHVECIDKWLNNQSNCPTCRTEVAPFVEMPLEVAVEGEGHSESSGIKESGSSSRLSSFRRMISIDWSSSRRIQPSFVVQDVAQDHERQ